MNERDRVRRRRRLVGAGGAVTLVALGLGLAFSAGGTDTAAADPITVLGPAGSPTGQPVDGISSSEEEQLAFHIHAHLQIYVDGQQRALPPGVGIVPPLQVQSTSDGPFVIGGSGIYWLHTHDSSGIIHIESPVQREFTLGEVFDVWGQPLGPQQVGPAKRPVTALVNGVGGHRGPSPDRPERARRHPARRRCRRPLPDLPVRAGPVTRCSISRCVPRAGHRLVNVSGVPVGNKG